MTITRKEKVLIFILILFILVGGTFVLGIMPKNNNKKALEEELAAVNSDITTVDTKVKATNDSAFNKLVAQIKEGQATLDDLSDPNNDVNEEIQSGSQIGQGDATSVALAINNYFASAGIKTTGIKVSAGTQLEGRIRYTFNTSFDCANSAVMWNFVDMVARNVSFNITSLDFSEKEDGTIRGTVGFSITYLP